MDGTELGLPLGCRLGCKLSDGTLEGPNEGMLEGSIDCDGTALGELECSSLGWLEREGIELGPKEGL